MASMADPGRSPFSTDAHGTGLYKSIPILPSSSTGSSLTPPRDPMDVTPSGSTVMGPPLLSSPGADRNGGAHIPGCESEPVTNGNGGPAIGAAAAAQQPKVVQTAFIHKLYNMLEDQSIQHLISWSSTNESFVMSPSSEFSKVLASYFKHTNISSFVRQLNMYGFHKVSDVFHTGAPDSPLWEFKHGNGNFKRGDLVGLREIKRRASRHALIHRDSFPAGPKVAAPPMPGTPVEPMPDPVEARLSMLEHNLYDMHNRVARSEDAHAYVTSKCQMLTDGLLRCHQWSHEIANYIMAMVPDPENQLHKDVALMQREIARQTEMLRAFDEPQEPPPAARPSYFQQHVTEPLSPRQMAHDERRRPSLAGSSHPGSFRAPVPAHLAVSPRRYGSIGSTNSPSSIRAPNYAQPPPPPPPVIQHPLATVCSPPASLARRHTSADIRAHGWPAPQPPPPGPGPGPGPAHSPYASGQNSTQWPSSPHRAPSLAVPGDQSLRDALAAYEINRNPRAHPQQQQQQQQGHGSRQPTPPPLVSDTGSGNLSAESGWSLPGPRYPFRGIDASGPPTRRSSMASNVHSLLNPAETVERADEDEGVVDDRKRKRVQ
ncbi:hypothetical protein W97_04615 [Coniosporium apollinis CBS 100218]|uniref:HSF-type DNA-binding domain-containing protein n=1 Tax=Coniosporium apollinis (strain CBS 100218) TaxID=1168221 RepID=R7YTX8_CONA1|nr:uncharacterized protein W97_04615 [Coniosporium apollinis CBS 100218]EON65377.1 hypothetical protein W97_04615 [Coniosporium apollinis CBS 100218]